MRNKALALVLVLLAAMSLGACTTVEPGHAGIKVNMWGSDRGVSTYPIVTGRVVYNPITTRVFEYPTFVQTAVWTANKTEGSRENEEICFNSKEGLVICGDYSLSFQLAVDQVPQFYVQFRSDDIMTWIHGFARNIARDALNETASKYGVEDLYGPQKEEFLQAVRTRINAQLNGYGHIEQFGFIGAPRLPDNVTKALNAKIQATQQAIQAENELRQAQAEAAKAVAAAEGQARSTLVQAQAQAEANRLLNASLTGNLIRWKELDVIRAKWDGSVPKFVTGDRSTMPMILGANNFQ